MSKKPIQGFELVTSRRADKYTDGKEIWKVPPNWDIKQIILKIEQDWGITTQNDKTRKWPQKYISEVTEGIDGEKFVSIAIPTTA